eukprot:SAG31_NODE_7782_length_1597_cov_1.469292_1_plen_364_part_00
MRGVATAALLLAVQLGARPSCGMLFTPSNPRNSMFDVWLYAQPNATVGGVPRYYLNYLSACDDCGGGPRSSCTCTKTPRGSQCEPGSCGMWNGVGAAASDDGVHFKDQGVAIHKDPNAVWLGSGSVLQNAAGEYVMNFSEEYDCAAANRSLDGNRCQSIFFATSRDLRNWTRVPFASAGPANTPPVNDSAVFTYFDGGLAQKVPGYEIGGRWDCIATVPKPGAPGHFYGFWTASPCAPAPAGADSRLGRAAGIGRAGVAATGLDTCPGGAKIVGAGVGETTDLSGRHWKALPPITDDFPGGEVGSVVILGGKYWMLFGGGHLYSSDSPSSGYKPDPNNYAFHTDGHGVLFSRSKDSGACHVAP